MTFRSLFVEEHPSQASATTPYVDWASKPDVPLFCSLNAYTWPTSAWGFAREHNLHMDYVDNCWLLVAVDAEMLRKFLNAGRTEDADVPGILERVTDDHWYVINEEEF